MASMQKEQSSLQPSFMAGHLSQPKYQLRKPAMSSTLSFLILLYLVLGFSMFVLLFRLIEFLCIVAEIVKEIPAGPERIMTLDCVRRTFGTGLAFAV